MSCGHIRIEPCDISADIINKIDNCYNMLLQEKKIQKNMPVLPSVGIAADTVNLSVPPKNNNLLPIPYNIIIGNTSDVKDIGGLTREQILSSIFRTRLQILKKFRASEKIDLHQIIESIVCTYLCTLSEREELRDLLLFHAITFKSNLDTIKDIQEAINAK